MSDPKGIAPGRIVTPADIQQKEFRVSRFGGYKMRDVDEFLDDVTDSLSRLVGEVERLRANAGAPPVIGTPDIDEVSRQADEIIGRAREEAARIEAAARARSASPQAGSGVPDPSAVSAFLMQEREFLQSLAGLVQGHAETVKGMARAARAAAGPLATAAATAPAATGDAGPEEGEEVESTSDRTPDTIHMPEEPIRVDEPSPATMGGGGEQTDRPEGSLRELFWGED